MSEAFSRSRHGWQDTLVQRFVERRLRGSGAFERLAYQDRATLAVLANLGVSTQLAAFGVLIAIDRPPSVIWLLLAELVLVTSLVLQRETRLLASVIRHQEIT